MVGTLEETSEGEGLLTASTTARLLDPSLGQIEQNNKSWGLNVFSSLSLSLQSGRGVLHHLATAPPLSAAP